MTDQTKPADIELARRIVRAAGIPPDAITAAAPTMLQKLEAADRQDAIDRTEAGQTFQKQPKNPEAIQAFERVLTDPRELWTHHSAKTMHRFFAGRCLTCRNWTPTKGDGGTCAVLPAALGYKSVASTAAVFGCTLYEEIPVEETDTIRARTELAIALGLLAAFPEGATDG